MPKRIAIKNIQGKPLSRFFLKYPFNITPLRQPAANSIY